MTDQNNCKHKFQPRYNEIYTTGLEQMLKYNMQNVEGSSYDLTRSYLQQKIYIYDICIKCGLTITLKENKDNKHD